MDTFMGLILLVGIIGVVMLWQKFTGAVGGAVGKKINQTVTPKSYNAGRTLVADNHDFRVQATPTEVKNAIVGAITAGESAPAVKPALYLVGAKPGAIVYDYGSKLQTVFRFVVGFEGSGDKTTGAFGFTNWMESDGMVARQKEMRQLNAEVEAALRRLDPAASITVSRD